MRRPRKKRWVPLDQKIKCGYGPCPVMFYQRFEDHRFHSRSCAVRHHNEARQVAYRELRKLRETDPAAEVVYDPRDDAEFMEPGDPEKANPLKARDTGKDPDRQVMCVRYAACLNFVLKQGWINWRCGSCRKLKRESYEPRPADSRELI